MANRAAKNMSSLDSQTMVPTETMFGRFTCAWCEGAIDVDTAHILANGAR